MKNNNPIIPEKLQKIMNVTKNLHGRVENLVRGVSELSNINGGSEPPKIMHSTLNPLVTMPTIIPYPPHNTYSEYAITKVPFRYIPPAPQNQNELLERSAVRYEALLNQSKLIKRIFRNKVRISKDRSLYCINNYVIAIKGVYCKEVDSFIPPGGWANLSTLQHGRDIIELYAAYRGCDYKRSLLILSKSLQIDISSLKKTYDNKNWWIQVKDPVTTPQLFNYLDTGCKLQSSYEYTNDIGEIIGYLYNIQLPTGEMTYYFKTLWRHHLSEICYWLDLFPSKPLMIYNEHNIAQNPDALIVFATDEKQAKDLQSKNDVSKYVFSACPGGLENIPAIDFSILRRRRISVILKPNSPEIQKIPEFINNAKSADISNIQLTFDLGDSFLTSDDFMTDPGKWGCNIESECEEESKNKYKIVPSGVKAEGEDTENKILLHPIIEEGNIIWIFGEAKSFKSWIGYTFACALSIGNLYVGKWKSGDAVRVLYIDGEMRPNKIRKRISLILKGLGYCSIERPFDIYIVKDSSGLNIDTDILSEEWQKKMEAELKGIDVIIIDNFYSLTDNSQKAVKSAITSFGKLTQAGKTVIVLDHSNREGDLQGSIAKERAADLVIKIEPDKDVKNKVKISLPKPRDLHPNDTESFELLMVFEDGSFKIELVEDQKIAKPDIPKDIIKYALAYFCKEIKMMTYKETESEMGIPKSTIEKHLKRDIPKLTGQDKKMYEEELSRLIAEDEITALT